MTPFQNMLKKASPLTVKQHAMLRDAGLPKDVVSTLSKADYQDLREKIQYDDRTGPALPTQIAYLKSVKLDPPEGVSYEKCRLVIRQHEKDYGDDEKYLTFIRAYEAHNAGRAERKRNAKAKAEATPTKIDPVDEVEDTRYFTDDEEQDTSLDYDLLKRLHGTAEGADTFMQRIEQKRQEKWA